MKLSEQTLEILKNFSNINTGIYINKGNTLQTTEKLDQSMAAYATIKESFPQEFGIYDLNKLLSIFSLSKEIPEIDFDNYHMTITTYGGKSTIKYRFCTEEMLTVPKKKLSMEDDEVIFEFDLDREDYVWVNNAAKILATPSVGIKSDGKNVYVISYDAKNDSIPDQSLKMNVDPEGKTFNLVLDFSNWSKMIPGSYTVKFDEFKSHFKNIAMDLEYFIGLDVTEDE
jgi:hypothetical protein